MTKRKMNLFEFRKELEEKDTSELLADFLLASTDAELWNLLREILLAMRVRASLALEDLGMNNSENPQMKALNLLYTFSRFIQMRKRFPNKEEQREILTGKDLPTMLDLLRKIDASGRERILKEKDERARLKGYMGVPED